MIILVLSGGRITSAGNLESMGAGKQTVVYLGTGPVADEQCRWLEQAGLIVEQVSGIARFEKMAANAAALVVDLSSGDSEITCIDAVARVMATLATSPGLVFLSDRADQETRLRAVRAGGDCFLLKPVSPAMLMSHLQPALLAADHSYRVLLIGESQGLLLEQAAVLQQQGLVVKQVDSVSQALLAVINYAPDLLMIEQKLSCCRGDQLGKMFHQLADYADLPGWGKCFTSLLTTQICRPFTWLQTMKIFPMSQQIMSVKRFAPGRSVLLSWSTGLIGWPAWPESAGITPAICRPATWSRSW